jgi:tRNA nucleotidyltransferase (CCA-adding enzyme)
MVRFYLTPTQSEIIVEIYNHNSRVWIMGDTLALKLLADESNKFDLITDLPAETLRKHLLSAKFTIIPNLEAFSLGILYVVDKDTSHLIAIKTLSSESIHTELDKYDLNIDVIAGLINSKGEVDTIIDPYKVQESLLKQEIVYIKSATEAIQKNPISMIKACRFTALGEKWHLSKTTSETILNNIYEYIRINKQFIRDEIIQVLLSNKPSNFFRTLDATNLLRYVFPDLKEGVGCKQNQYHTEPVFDHLLRCCDASVEFTDDPFLRLAALTHDIAKPHTKSVDKDNNIHFYKHEIVGASIIYKWMSEHEFTTEQIEYVSKLVRYHQWRFEENTKDKTLRRWLYDVGKYVWRDLIILRCADRKGNLAKVHKPIITREMQELLDRVDQLIATGKPIFKEDLAINSNDLINLNHSLEKQHKEIFRELMGLVINEPEKNTKADLLAFVNKHYLA